MMCRGWHALDRRIRANSKQHKQAAIYFQAFASYNLCILVAHVPPDIIVVLCCVMLCCSGLCISDRTAICVRNSCVCRCLSICTEDHWTAPDFEHCVYSASAYQYTHTPQNLARRRPSHEQTIRTSQNIRFPYNNQHHHHNIQYGQDTQQASIRQGPQEGRRR